MFSHGKSLYKLALDHIASALDSEKAWLDYIDNIQLPENHRARYVRLNPQLEEDPPSLDDVNRMLEIQGIVREKLSSEYQIQMLALQLIASSFYFEKLPSHGVEIMKDGSVRCKGKLFGIGSPGIY